MPSWRDVQASRDMYYDEEHARDLAKRNALLDTPVTDFELSVRARNCLKKMQIRTLGDLLKISEAELLSYKNFGETSLVEIKNDAGVQGPAPRPGPRRVSTAAPASRSTSSSRRQGAEAVLNKPISVLDLSVRARKALQLLNIQTLGDLATTHRGGADGRQELRRHEPRRDPRQARRLRSVASRTLEEEA